MTPAERLGHDGPRFWDRYDDACQEAQLLEVPAVAVSAVVGPLAESVGLVRACCEDHWSGDCDVVVLTERPELVAGRGWSVTGRTSDLVASVEAGSDFPLVVIDIPDELPAWLRPLLDRLRCAGLGLVRYALAGDPSDEDLATWHGEIGGPAVLDLLSPLPPARVLSLLDRGEPVASVAGAPISSQLLVALRTDVAEGGPR